jgi:iron complex transport system ATP-binding protein
VTNTVFETKSLTIGYPLRGKQSKVVNSDINLSVRRGELVCLLGPNGAGKSTFLRTMAAMQTPLEGEVLLEGKNIHRIDPRELARRLSVVLTERVTAGLLSVYALVSLGRYPYTDWAGRLTDRDHEVIRRSIEMVGAVDLAHRPVSELSDGERQKVMVARALAQEPSFMILDEITAFLDLPRRVEIMRVLRRLAHDHGRTILLSTHDLELALRCADRVWLMPKGGRIVSGAPEDLILNGAFESVFAAEGVEFDRQAGHFRLHETTVGEAAVLGEGVVAAWTARALERLGYLVTSSPSASISVEIIEENGNRSWVASRAGTLVRHHSIEDLSNFIRQH